MDGQSNQQLKEDIPLNSKELFSLALGLQFPWKLNDVDFAEENSKKILRIDIGFEKGPNLPIPKMAPLLRFMIPLNANGDT